MDAKRDSNRVTTLLGVSNVDGTTPVTLYADPTTHRLLVSSDAGAGTVTSVAALTLGTTGTDLSSTVANGTTTPVITLNVPNASASNRGALSAADWTTFNAKAPSTSPTFATSITGSYLTSSEMLITDADKKIVSAPVATYPSLTELSYVKGLTSAIQTQLGALVPNSLYDAHTVLYATTDDTPAALTVGEQTVVGRATGGNISALAIDSDLSSVSANDDTIPSAKATKAALDGKMSNPMTTAGDVIYGGASGTPTRLGVGTAGQVLTVNSGATAPEWATASGGTSLWTAITGTRVSNTTITVATDLTAIFKKGMIVRWQESGVDKVAYVSIPSTYSDPNTTITICGSTCASIDASSFKYSSILDIEQFARQFAYAGTVGATATDVMNAYYAPEPMLVLGAELYTGTVASTSGNTVIDINKGGTTMFTAKPTIAYNALTVATPFAADSGSALALNDRVSIDIDTVTSTTFPVDLYVSLKIFPSRFLTLE